MSIAQMMGGIAMEIDEAAAVHIFEPHALGMAQSEGDGRRARLMKERRRVAGNEIMRHAAVLVQGEQSILVWHDDGHKGS